MLRAREELPVRHLCRVVDQSGHPGYILRSWSLVRMGTAANHRKVFFHLREAKSKILALDEGDTRPDQAKLIAKRLGVTEQHVIDMNRRLGGDASLNAPIREDSNFAEWQDRLVDEIPGPGDDACREVMKFTISAKM